MIRYLILKQVFSQFDPVEDSLYLHVYINVLRVSYINILMVSGLI